MRSRRLCEILLAVSVLAPAGCRPQQLQPAGSEVLDAPEGTVSVYDLAGRLGLDVVEASKTCVFLRNYDNSVMIYPDPGGRAYVNGRPVGSAGGMACVGDTLFVPVGVEGHIRAALRSRRRRRESTYTPPPPRPGPKPQPYRVVIDPGHGGRDPGAASCLGFSEKTVNMAVARKVVRMLGQPRLEATLTRSGNRFVELNGRPEVANRLRADLFVSIHADHCPDPGVRGFSVYVARAASPQSLAAAEAVAAALARTGMQSRGIRRADFRVLVRSRCPALLVEMGYLSNAADSTLLADGGFQRRLAHAIATGICDYLSGR